MGNDSIAPRDISGINKVGLSTLIRKEVERFMNVYLQTIIAPVITTLLYMEFLAPGLIMMTMVQNAFTNSSSSIVIAKVQGNIVDVLMPPLSSFELLAGYTLGGVTRGIVVGFVTCLAMMFFVNLSIHSLGLILGYAFLGTLMLSSIGLIAGIWAEKFDHIASVTNFIVTPLAFLSGTFYSINSLPDVWINIAYVNPFFYMIDGFRFGFTGHTDGYPLFGLLFLATINVLLLLLSWGMLKSGYKIKT
jgi:ABC-2 type transport system permease protein